MSNIVKAEEKFLSISKVIDSEISTVLASNVNGFQKAFVMSSAIAIIREQLTDEYMAPIMMLQGSSLGFKTDLDTIKEKDEKGKWVTKKGPGYPLEIVRECLIEAIFLGLEVTGNQFNIIGENMYPTREGFGGLLDKMKGLKKNFEYKNIQQPAGQKVAYVTVSITWQLEGESAKKQIIEFPIKSNEYTSYDALVGKAERKAKRWLTNTIKGTDISDGDVADIPHVEIVEKEANKLETLIDLLAKTKDYLSDKEVTYAKRIIKDTEVASYDKAIEHLTSKLPKDA
jgi:hypothetical protein